VVSSKIPRYLKVYTRSMNVTFKHKLLAWVNIIKHHDFCFFFTFIISPHLAQNYWNVSNYCYNPILDYDVKARSSTKINSHTCMSTTTDALHSLLSKHPSKGSKYNPNNRGLRGQPGFTPC
jgi:hypothetical protein